MQSPNLNLPLIAPSQAMKHVTHNEALVRLDAITQLSVEALGATVPPALAQEGVCYALGASAQGAWSGHDAEVAVFSNGGWLFVVPQPGWRAWDVQTAQLHVFSGGQWLSVDPSFNNIDGLGINSAYDSVNRLSLSSEASLFNHEGAGHQIKINKATDTDTASLLFQSGFTGHAEIGLTGDTDLSFKVSDDGVNFTTGVKVRTTDGAVDVPCLRSGRILVGLDAVGEIPTPGVGGMVAISLVDAAFPQTSHSGLFCYDTGDTLSLRSLAVAPGMIDQGATLLTGTTGTSGRTNVSARAGVLQIENRYKVNTYYSYTFINSF